MDDCPDTSAHQIGLVEEAFAFLEERFGFERIPTRQSSVYYESACAFIKIEVLPGKGPRLSFGPLRAPRQIDNCFDAEDLADLTREAVLPWLVGSFETEDQWCAALQSCAAFLLERARAVLRGDRRTFERLAQTRRQRNQEHGTAIAERLAQRDSCSIRVRPPTDERT